MTKTRYILIGTQRSGTTVTHLALKGHPSVSALNDEMRIEPFFTSGLNTFTYGNNNEEEEEKFHLAAFDVISLMESNENTIAHGVKIASSSITKIKALVNTLQENMKDVKIIIIERQDLVAQHGSAKAGQKSGVMHSWSKGYNNKINLKIKINRWRFIAYVRKSIKVYAELAKLKNTHDVIEIHYEDILTAPSEVYSQLFNFLNLPTVEPVWLKSKKVMPSPSNYIINYEDMTTLMKKVKEGRVSTFEIVMSKVVTRLLRYFNKAS